MHVNEIECFIADNNKVFALYIKNKYRVKYKLYEIYELFNDNFIYINQRCLINVSKIKCFDVNFGGALKVILKSGYSDYVSRRQVKNIKERLGIINERIVNKFCLRGMMFASGGPLTYGIVMLILYLCGEDTTSDGLMIFRGILSTSILAFLVAGASILWQEERLGLAGALVIHGLFLYISYFIVYVINGLIAIELKSIGIFTLVFIIFYSLLYIVLYTVERIKVGKINSGLNK